MSENGGQEPCDDDDDDDGGCGDGGDDDDGDGGCFFVHGTGISVDHLTPVCSSLEALLCLRWELWPLLTVDKQHES